MGLICCWWVYFLLLVGLICCWWVCVLLLVGLLFVVCCLLLFFLVGELPISFWFQYFEITDVMSTGFCIQNALVNNKL